MSDAGSLREETALKVMDGLAQVIASVVEEPEGLLAVMEGRVFFGMVDDRLCALVGVEVSDPT